LVLVDGRTEYQDFIGVTLWPALPVGLEEIDRIEIIRGPGSALYGANAMLGVINIITRNPGNPPPAEFNAIGGMGNTAGGSFVASSAVKKLRYRASVGYLQEDKWSRDFADDRPDIVSRVADSSLGLRSVRGNLTTRYQFTDDVSVGASAGVNRLFTELYPLGLLRNYFLDGTSSYVQADSTLGPLKARAFWNQLEADAGPQYEAIGARSLATHVSSHVFSGEVLFSRELQLAGTHRLDVGVSGRLKRVGWTYLDAFHQELHGAAFVQDEWRIIDPVRIVGSYRIDRHPLLDNGKPGYAQSPRISALYFPAQGHALRASFSTAFREPTYLESYTAIRLPLPGVNGGSALTTGDTTLKPEQLTAFELGYRGELPASGLEWDLALYRNDVRNLITLSGLQPLPADQSYDPATQSFLIGRSKFENEKATYTALGAEVGVTVAPLDRLEVRGSGAWQRITQSGVASGTPCAPCSQAPQFKLYGGVTYRAAAGVDLSGEVNYVTATTWIEREPAASDPTQIEAKQNPLPAYTVINARLAYRLFKDKLTVGIVGSQLGSPHREHPFGNLIDRRLFATLTVTP
ncbi:MAG: TonB-dependent receptor plug domain-containing protein, partial [Myxococcaceae bacterium]